MSKVQTEVVGVDHDDDGPLVRIGELGRRAGLPPATLRAWERRYGIVSPRRGESGYRLYGESDERRLRRMIELIASGLAPAEAARRALDPAGGADDEPGGIEAAGGAGLVAGCRESLALAFSEFDDRAADRVLDRAVAVLSIDALLDDVLLPVLRGLEGDTIGREHFASNLIRGRLLALARGWGGGEGRLAVLACPEGELHDLGLIAFGLALRARGWRIGFLGANMPIAAIVTAAGEMDPAVVVLCALTGGAFDGSEPELTLLAQRTHLHLAGPGAPGGLAEGIGATYLREGPVAAAALVA